MATLQSRGRSRPRSRGGTGHASPRSRPRAIAGRAAAGPDFVVTDRPARPALAASLRRRGHRQPAPPTPAEAAAGSAPALSRWPRRAGVPRPTRRSPPALDLHGLRNTVLAAARPGDDRAGPHARRSSASAARLTWHPADPLEPIMAAPAFPQPMYAPLRDLSQQYLLPGVDQIPPDTSACS